MHEITAQDCSRIAQDLQIRKLQVESVVQLLDEGNTVPFITRYRKERTGSLNEEFIRQIQTRVNSLRHLGERKETILKSIEGQGKLTPELRQAILKADTTKRLEDLYLPYKPKKKSAATKAREQGLEPVALAIWHSDASADNLAELLPTLVNAEKELATAEDVQTGVKNILAEMMAETAIIRADVRSILWETGKIVSAKSEKLGEGQGLEYKDYFEFSEGARQIPPHRILALNRGEKEQALKARLEANLDIIKDAAIKALAETLLNAAGQMPAPARLVPPAQAAAESTPSPAESAETTPPGESSDPSLTQTIEVAPALVQSSNSAAEHSTSTPLDPSTLKGEALVRGGLFKSPHAAFLRSVLDDALARLVIPSLEREIRRELTDEAESHAVAVFARNLRSLLLQPPLRNRRVLAIDPGFRTGCKVAALDEYGNLLEHAIIYPHTPPPRKAKEKPAKPTEAPSVPMPSAEQASQPPSDQVAQANAATSAEPEIADAPIATTVSAPAETPPATIVDAPVQTPEAAAPASSDSSVSAADGAPSADAVAAASESVSATPPVDRKAEAKAKLQELVAKHNLQVVALGNGTGCRETEEVVADLIATSTPELAYVIVSEAGASVYSTSSVGREEFPDFDATLRSTISIGRRLQDPLSELVKVDPHNIGVGLYQHDVGRRELKESLEAVVESCVNQVGVDLNTASVPLLRHVSGLNQLVARELVDYRNQNGPFSGREALLQVSGLGPARYVQAAGFLKIPSGPNPLDRTWIHPESYPVAEHILADLGYAPNVLDDKGAQTELQAKLKTVNAGEASARLNIGVPTVEDILHALARPGLDPREDLPPPIFKQGILKLEDLQPGMELKGTVLNVVDFGAFVDIGLKDSGLVHISQMANRYIKSPYDVVGVNDVVTVWVLTVDKDRHRVSLSMIKPGTERKPPERKPAMRQEPSRDSSRPPHGRRPADAPQGPRPSGRHQGPPRGRGPGAGGRRGPGAPPHGHGQGRPPAEQTGPGESATAATPIPPPRRPRREPPRPKLTQAALEGKVPLRTFGELSALFAAKKEEPSRPQESAPASMPSSADTAPAPAANAVEDQPREATPTTDEVPNPGA